MGAANTKLEGLNDLASILDEVGKGSLEQDDGVILSQLNDLRDLISQAITNGVGTYDSLIRTSVSALATYFNSYADALSGKIDDYTQELDQQVTQVNDIPHPDRASQRVDPQRRSAGRSGPGAAGQPQPAAR